MYRLIVLIFLLLPAMAWGTSEDTITITQGDIPYIIDSSGVYILDGTKLTATHYGIGINGDAGDTIILDGGEGMDTLVYNTGDNDDAIGLAIRNASTSKVTVKRLWIINGLTDTTAEWQVGVGVYSSVNLTLDSLFIETYGGAGNCVQAHPVDDYQGYYFDGTNADVTYSAGINYRNFRITNNQWWNWTWGYDNRMHLDGYAFEVGYLGDTTVADTILFFDNIICHTSGQGAISISNQAGTDIKIYVQNCSLNVDSRNWYYSYPSDQSYQGSTNAWPLRIDGMYHDSIQVAGSINAWIHDNALTCGNQFQGGDGAFMVENLWGSAEDTVRFYDNNTEVHRGECEHYGDLNVKILKFRYWRGAGYVHVHDNTLIAYSSVEEDSTGYGPSAIGMDYEGALEYGYDMPKIIIEDNFIRVQCLDGGCDYTTVTRMSAHTDSGIWSDSCVWRKNDTETDEFGYWLGSSYGGSECGANNVLIEGDTITYISSAETFYPVRLGAWGSPTKNCILRDVTGIIDSVSYHPSYPADDDVEFQYTCTLYVKGTNDLMKADQPCTLEYNTSTLTIDTTNSEGYIDIILRSAKRMRQSDDTVFVPIDFYTADSTLEIVTLSPGLKDTLVANVTGDVGAPPPNKKLRGLRN